MTQLLALTLKRPDWCLRARQATDAQALTLQSTLQPLTSLSRLHIGAYCTLVHDQAAALLSALTGLRKLRVVSVGFFEEVPALPVELMRVVVWCDLTRVGLPNGGWRMGSWYVPTYTCCSAAFVARRAATAAALQHATRGPVHARARCARTTGVDASTTQHARASRLRR